MRKRRIEWRNGLCVNAQIWNIKCDRGNIMRQGRESRLAIIPHTKKREMENEYNKWLTNFSGLEPIPLCMKSLRTNRLLYSLSFLSSRAKVSNASSSDTTKHMNKKEWKKKHVFCSVFHHIFCFRIHFSLLIATVMFCNVLVFVFFWHISVRLRWRYHSYSNLKIPLLNNGCP